LQARDNCANRVQKCTKELQKNTTFDTTPTLASRSINEVTTRYMSDEFEIREPEEEEIEDGEVPSVFSDDETVPDDEPLELEDDEDETEKPPVGIEDEEEGLI
jgi:hypothetical protein